MPAQIEGLHRRRRLDSVADVAIAQRCSKGADAAVAGGGSVGEQNDMKQYWIIAGSVLALLLILFVLVESLGVPLLTNPSPWLKDSGTLAAVIGVGLLVIDVALPVPSSLVMVAHGALFGVVIGTLLSVVGSTGAAIVGLALGRRGGPLLARLVPPEERARADRLLAQWGTLAIIVTRPVPLVAETTAIMAGASSLGWRRVAVAALAGSLPGALLYALTGAVSANLHNGALIFLLMLFVAGFSWLVGRWLEPSLTRPEGERVSGSS
jgi:uncharacterized membrane protein YdjX (TVP38/TMEM64 family)